MNSTTYRSLKTPSRMTRLKGVIMHMPNEKAPGPHGFIGLFYKKMLGNHP
jgi:hypothetical protein